MRPHFTVIAKEGELGASVLHAVFLKKRVSPSSTKPIWNSRSNKIFIPRTECSRRRKSGNVCSRD